MILSPKEKAEELVLRYLRINNNTKEWFNLHIAKQCALIAVDEIIKAIPDASDDDSPYNHELLWWQEVKEEILNL